jgi:hypothetical protein
LISVPTNYTLKGSCNATLNDFLAQNLVIEFYDSWNLTIFFSSDVKETQLLAATTPTKYSISQIELEYDYNSNLFLNVDDSREHMFLIFTHVNNHLFGSS